MKPSVLHIITGLENGGAEAVLFRLCTVETKCTHIVVSMMGMGKYGPLLENHGIAVYTLEFNQGRLNIRGLYKLREIINKNKPDVVQGWMYHANLIGGLCAYVIGVKRIYWGIHHTSLNPDVVKKSTIIVSKILSLLSHWIPSAIICCANSSVDVHAQAGYSKRKLKCIPNGYDLSLFKPSIGCRNLIRKELNIDNLWVVGMVARFDVLKDHVNLLNALVLLRNYLEDFVVLLVGDGMDQKNNDLDLMIKSRNLENQIQLLGRRADVPQIMNALDVHVLSSMSEAFPNVVAEAMACETPCVVTDVGDAAYIVGDTGWVVPFKDPQSLSEALYKSYLEFQDSAKWQIRCKASRERVSKKFSLDLMANEYFDIWTN